MKIAYLLLLISIFKTVENYKILGIFPVAGKSHMFMFEALMKGLAAKGHEVDVVSHFPQKTPLLRYNDISLVGTAPIFMNNVSIEFALSNIGSTLDAVKFIIGYLGVENCRAVLSSPILKNLLHTKKKYDLLITEIFGSDCMLGFAHHFQIPSIGITSSVALPWEGDRVGNPDNPSYIPNYLLPYLSSMSFKERLMNTLVLLLCKFGYKFSEDMSTEISREFFGQDLPHLTELAYNMSLIFVNSHFSVNQARPFVPNFVEIGGIHIQSLKPLPKYLEDSLKLGDKYKGIIYLSMGSMLKTETLPLPKLKALFQAFSRLPYKVLWKGEKTNLPEGVTLPSNIQFENWLPQLDVLCHPNVKLFVSHGGLMGTQEGIYCGVPRLGIPLFADQELNLKISETMGLAIILKLEDITEENVFQISKKLLEDKRYQENAKRISTLFRDRQNSALDTAIYWVEYVIKYNGAPHLRSAGSDLPWYQYFLLDIIAVLGFIFLISVFIVYYIISFVLNKLFYSNFNDKSKRD